MSNDEHEGSAIVGVGGIVPSEPAKGRSIQEVTLDKLAVMEGAMQVVEKKQEMHTFFMNAAIAMTRPQDWVLNKDRDGNETALLCAPAAEKIAALWGIQIPADSIRPRDEQGIPRPELQTKGDERIYTIYYRAKCALTGMEYSFEFSRSSKEKFLGRNNSLTNQGELTEESDHRKSVLTGMLTNAVRHITGLRGLTANDLKERGVDTSGCRRGHGYGTSTQRGAESVSDDNLIKLQDEFGEELMKRTGGDKAAAKKLCAECSSWTGKDGQEMPGVDTPRQLTRGAWQIKKAWEKLREHPVFGDNAEPEPQK